MDLKDIQQIHTSSNGHAHTGQALNSFYYKPEQMSFIAKKTEKIATAIYMVTDFLVDSEPLKIQLRTLAISLICTTQKLPQNTAEAPLVMSVDIMKIIEATLTFLLLATTLGLVSEMNGTILKNELVKIQTMIKESSVGKNMFITSRTGVSEIHLTEELFGVEKTPLFDKGHDYNKGQIESENVLYKKEEKILNSVTSFTKKTDLGNKIARRNDVLAVVRNKGKVSIKDITEILKDIGSKTLQRELHGLVQEGVLIKEGDKRWSMYRIAS